MKTFVSILLVVIAIPAISQSRMEWSAGYTFASPSGKMQQNIRQGHGVTLGLHRVVAEQGLMHQQRMKQRQGGLRDNNHKSHEP